MLNVMCGPLNCVKIGYQTITLARSALLITPIYSDYPAYITYHTQCRTQFALLQISVGEAQSSQDSVPILSFFIFYEAVSLPHSVEDQTDTKMYNSMNNEGKATIKLSKKFFFDILFKRSPNVYNYFFLTI